MIILAVDSSAKSASVAIVKDGNVIVDFLLSAGLTHSETLVPMMRNALSAAKLDPKEITHCAVSKGPGSFTGIRIGVCAVKGFALPFDIPCVGVSTLEAMAYNAIDHEGIVCCCMDARRNQVYNALFSVSDGKLTRLTEDRAISITDLEKELSQQEKTIFLVGDGAQLCYNYLDANDHIRLLTDPCRLQRAVGVAYAAQQAVNNGLFESASQLLPSYLRPSQAERERAAKLQSSKTSE